MNHVKTQLLKSYLKRIQIYQKDGA